MTAPAGDQQQDNAGQGSDAGSGGGAQSGAITQEQMNKILAAQKREIESKYDGYDDLKAKAEQLDSLTEAAQSDLERVTGQANDWKSKAEGAETKAQTLEKQLLRHQISAKQQLDPDLWDRVKGDTAEEIEADVKALVTKFGTSGGGSRPPKGLQSGASAADSATKKERAAAAVRGMAR